MGVDHQAIKDLIRSSGFQDLPVGMQHAQLGQMMRGQVPSFRHLQQHERERISGGLIRDHTPSYAGAALGLITRAGEAFQTEQAIPKKLREVLPEKVLESPWRRAGLMASIDAATAAVGLKAGALLLKHAAPALGWSTPATVQAQVGKSLVPGAAWEAAETGLRAGGGAAGKAWFTERMVTDLTAGAVMGIAEEAMAEHHRPWHSLVGGPLAMAGLGMLFGGVGYGIKRYGASKVKNVQTMLDIDPAVYASEETAAQQMTHAFSSMHPQYGLDEAVELWTRVGTDQASEAEARLVRNFFMKEPHFLNHEIGLHMVRAIRPVMQTKVTLQPSGPPFLRYESMRRPSGETRIVGDHDIVKFLEQVKAGKVEGGPVHIVEVAGPERLVAPFRDPKTAPQYRTEPSTYPQTEVAIPQPQQVVTPEPGPKIIMPISPGETAIYDTVVKHAAQEFQGLRSRQVASVGFSPDPPSGPSAFSAGITEMPRRGTRTYMGDPAVPTPAPSAPVQAAVGDVVQVLNKQGGDALPNLETIQSIQTYQGKQYALFAGNKGIPLEQVRVVESPSARVTPEQRARTLAQIDQNLETLDAQRVELQRELADIDLGLRRVKGQRLVTRAPPTESVDQLRQRVQALNVRARDYENAVGEALKRQKGRKKDRALDNLKTGRDRAQQEFAAARRELEQKIWAEGQPPAPTAPAAPPIPIKSIGDLERRRAGLQKDLTSVEATWRKWAQSEKKPGSRPPAYGEVRIEGLKKQIAAVDREIVAQQARQAAPPPAPPPAKAPAPTSEYVPTEPLTDAHIDAAIAAKPSPVDPTPPRTELVMDIDVPPAKPTAPEVMKPTKPAPAYKIWAPEEIKEIKKLYRQKKKIDDSLNKWYGHEPATFAVEKKIADLEEKLGYVNQDIDVALDAVYNKAYHSTINPNEATKSVDKLVELVQDLDHLTESGAGPAAIAKLQKQINQQFKATVRKPVPEGAKPEPAPKAQPAVFDSRVAKNLRMYLDDLQKSQAEMVKHRAALARKDVQPGTNKHEILTDALVDAEARVTNATAAIAKTARNYMKRREPGVDLDALRAIYEALPDGPDPKSLSQIPILSSRAMKELREHIDFLSKKRKAAPAAKGAPPDMGPLFSQMGQKAAKPARQVKGTPVNYPEGKPGEQWVRQELSYKDPVKTYKTKAEQEEATADWFMGQIAQAHGVTVEQMTGGQKPAPAAKPAPTPSRVPAWQQRQVGFSVEQKQLLDRRAAIQGELESISRKATAQRRIKISGDPKEQAKVAASQVREQLAKKVDQLGEEIKQRQRVIRLLPPERPGELPFGASKAGTVRRELEDLQFRLAELTKQQIDNAEAIHFANQPMQEQLRNLNYEISDLRAVLDMAKQQDAMGLGSGIDVALAEKQLKSYDGVQKQLFAKIQDQTIPDAPLKAKPEQASNIHGGSVTVGEPDPRGVRVTSESGESVLTSMNMEGQVDALPSVQGKPLKYIVPEEVSTALAESNVVLIVPGRSPLQSGARYATQPLYIPGGDKGVVTLRDLRSNNVVTASVEHVENLIRAGVMRPWKSPLSSMSIEEVANTAKRAALAVSRSPSDKASWMRFGTLENSLFELQKRLNRVYERVPIKYGDIIARIDELAAQGPVSVANLRRKASRIPDNTLVQLQAKALGGEGFKLRDGRVIVELPLGPKNRKLMMVYQNDGIADEALRELVALRQEEARVMGLGRWAEQNVEIPSPRASPRLDENSPSLGAARLGFSEDTQTLQERTPDKVRQGEIPPDPGNEGRFIGGEEVPWYRDVAPVNVVLPKLGKAGEELSEMVTLAFESEEMMFGRWQVAVEDALSGVKPEHLKDGTFAKFVEKGVGGTPEMERAWAQLKPVLDDVFKTSEGVGLPVEKYIGRYFPHMLDTVKARKAGGHRTAIIESLMKTHDADNAEKILQGIASKMTPEEAEKILADYIAKSRISKAPNLELPREFKTVQYMRDAELVYNLYLRKAARRIAQAEHFGVKHEKALNAIHRVDMDYSDPGYKFARKVYDYAVGNEYSGLDGLMGAVYDWQGAKLSMSFLSNATQPLNIAVKTDLATFTKAMFGTVADMIRDPEGFTKRARMVGAISNSMLSDMRHGGLVKRTLEGALDDAHASLVRRKMTKVVDLINWPFRFVEGFNRAVAVRAGEIWIKDLQMTLRRNPADKAALHQIKKYMKMDPEDVMRGLTDAGKQEQLLSLAGKRISDITQFQAGLMQMPLWQQHPMGRFVFQFKSFAINQMRFMMDEIVDPIQQKDWGRVAKNFTILFGAFPVAGGFNQQIRELLAAEDKSKAWDEFIANPVNMTSWAGYFGSVGSAGVLGIAGDVAGGLVDGNQFSLQALALPPASGTFLSVPAAIVSGVKATVTGDTEEAKKAGRGLLREFGGVGTVLGRSYLGPDE